MYPTSIKSLSALVVLDLITVESWNPIMPVFNVEGPSSNTLSTYEYSGSTADEYHPRDSNVEGSTERKNHSHPNMRTEKNNLEYQTEEPLVTESMTPGLNESLVEKNTAITNTSRNVAAVRRVKRGNMIIGRVSEAEREYIKFHLIQLREFVDYLKNEGLSPALDPPLDELQIALDKLVVDSDQLRA